MLSLGPHAVAVLDTAAELHHIAGLRPSGQIRVAVPGWAVTVRDPVDPWLVVHQWTVPAQWLDQVAGIPVTNPLRTLADLILRADRYPAVPVLDSALNRGLVSPDGLAAAPAIIRRRRGAVAARRYLAQADGRAQSPLETRVRLRCVDGRVAPDALQHHIRDADGYLLGVADLAWGRARLIAEADGAGPHRTPEALYEDRRRQNRITNAGRRVLRFTWSGTLRPDYIPYTVQQALTASSSRP